MEQSRCRRRCHRRRRRRRRRRHCHYHRHPRRRRRRRRPLPSPPHRHPPPFSPPPLSPYSSPSLLSSPPLPLPPPSPPPPPLPPSHYYRRLPADRKSAYTRNNKMDVELVTRASLTSLQNVDDGRVVSPNSLDEWTWSSLRKQFKYKNLEKLYTSYQRRLQYGYLSLFVLVEIILGFVYCFVLIMMVNIEECFPDVIVHSIIGALLCPTIALSFRSKIIAKNTYLPVLLSCLVVTLLVIGDLMVPLYYTLAYTEDIAPIRPTYATHTLLACYVFLPLTENLHAFVLGITATMCYLATLFLITYRNTPDYISKITTDAIYYVCVNGLGLYFRFMNEVVIRRSFLDRRKCVETTLKLNYEKDQEEQLTRSILPQHIAARIKKDFRDIFKFMEEHKKAPPKGRPRNDLCVETHNNVSILYADVVNFSGLTLSLPVRKLVETLNDLFGSFDEASERHNVLRIKFLGDCYYCVSGVPTPNSQHAKNCVDLGLDMIRIIKEVRTRVRRESGVDVNMRIGVHSGNIISGILGANKWQYDVWSRDVVIANKMEQTGKPGKVHVTQQTLDLINATEYDCVPVEVLNDEVLNKYGIRSYLITPVPPDTLLMQNSENTLTVITPDTSAPGYKHYVKFLTSARPSVSSSARRRLTSPTSDHADVFAGSYRRRTHFMDSCLRDYHLMLKAADAEMENAIKQMPLSKWQQWTRWEHINPIFLTYKQWNWEIPFLREPDPLFKFFVACAVFVLFFMGLISLVTAITLSEWHTGTAIGYTISMLFLLTLMPLTWMHFAWNRYKDPHDEGNVPNPRNKLIYFLYQTSVKIVWSALLRIILYLVMTIMLATCAMFDMIFECQNVDKLASDNVTSSIAQVGAAKLECISTPWVRLFTNDRNLLFGDSYEFPLPKSALLSKVTDRYCNGNILYMERLDISQQYIPGETWNPYLEPRVAHILSVVFLTFSLHLIDRQAEYLSRLDYQWKRQLTLEQDEAFHTRNANKLLLRNILPEHVAEFYLNMDRTEGNEPYHRAHHNVAVMFASLTDLSIDESNILIDLNDIICKFDKLLFEPYYVCRIEKIKIAGTTYMAACGLESNRRDSMHSLESDESSSDNVVKVMAEFAAQMMVVLDRINSESVSSKPYRLRIGISHGEVSAGVVGAHKPLYDIWGDAVNMASRMDTTGLPGKIQVTAETANVLEQQGVKCHLRGETWVKPKGYVTTYFVGIDERKQLQRTDSIEETSL
ncbi:adenylate cyclase type 2-like isoform X3 [Vespa mandarinia]|uniref:adenylate cyclase type 2-like isoform X3 n=1 Tax=Vespa mandarinia TaxID=7446 RepID=UPI00160FBD34|nr:adenylate cyclase type 2-like isoform X3 [Vespa mandarinia]